MQYEVKHLKRNKEIFERHQSGETYTTIAKELGISVSRVRQLAERWKREMSRQGIPFRQIRLNSELWQYAKTLGDGDESIGITLALEHHKLGCSNYGHI